MTHFSSLKPILSHAPLAALLPAGLAALLCAICSVLLLGASAYLIASAALHPPLYTLALSITLVRACGIGRAVFRYLDRWLSHRAVFHAQENLRLKLYEKASILLPLRAAGVRQAEFLHGLASGSDALRDFYLRAVAPPVIALALCMAGTAALAPVLGPGAAALLPLLWLLHLLIPAFLDKTATEGPLVRYRDLSLDMEQGACELRSAGSTSIAAQRLRAAARTLHVHQETCDCRRDRTDALLLLLRNACLALFLFLLAGPALEGGITGIELAVYLLALQTVIGELSPLPDALRTGRRGLASAQAIFHVPDTTGQDSSRKTSDHAPSQWKGSPPLLSLRGLCFSYRPGLPVLRDISFTLHPGEKLAIVGESGCGKTTLGCLLMGLWPPESGEIFLQGRNYATLPPEEIRAAFAPCLQGEYLFSHSIRENFRRIHPQISEDAIWRALAAAQMEEAARKLPQGLDAPLGEDGKCLSGGQRQRLLAALALASPAPILLLDEPTASLDKKTARALMEGILSSLEGRALIVITHDMVLADKMDRIYRMEAS